MAATPLSLTPFFVCLRSFGFPGRFSFGVSPFRLWMVGYLVFGLVVLLWLSGSFFWSVFRYQFARLRGMRPFASVVPSLAGCIPRLIPAHHDSLPDMFDKYQCKFECSVFHSYNLTTEFGLPRFQLSGPSRF